MKPEHGAKDFFAEVMGPVLPADVKQFVAGNRRLETELQSPKAVWKEYNRDHKAECDGRIHLGGKAELRGSSHESAHGLENDGGCRRRGNWGGGLAEPPKF